MLPTTELSWSAAIDGLIMERTLWTGCFFSLLPGIVFMAVRFHSTSANRWPDKIRRKKVLFSKLAIGFAPGVGLFISPQWCFLSISVNPSGKINFLCWWLADEDRFGKFECPTDLGFTRCRKTIIGSLIRKRFSTKTTVAFSSNTNTDIGVNF